MDYAERLKIAQELLGPGARLVKHANKKPGRTVSSLKTLSRTVTKHEYRSCLKKVRYRSRGEASWYANRASQNRGYKLRVYYCSKCNGYHITHHLGKNADAAE